MQLVATTDAPPASGETDMRQTMRDELGDRVCRALVMENSGKPSRRTWWIVSSGVLAECSHAA